MKDESELQPHIHQFMKSCSGYSIEDISINICSMLTSLLFSKGYENWDEMARNYLNFMIKQTKDNEPELIKLRDKARAAIKERKK